MAAGWMTFIAYASAGCLCCGQMYHAGDHSHRAVCCEATCMRWYIHEQFTRGLGCLKMLTHILHVGNSAWPASGGSAHSAVDV